RKKILASVIAIAAIGAFAGYAHSMFTDSKTASPSVFSTGSLVVTLDKTGAVYSLDHANIGDSADGNLTVTNDGTIAGDFVLTGAANSGTDSALASAITLNVYAGADADGDLLYAGSLAGFNSTDLGSIAPGDSQELYIVATLPSQGTQAANNALEGKTTS